MRDKSVTSQRAGLFLVLPAVLLITVFILLPLGRLLYLSFTNYSGLRPPEWAGLENYRFLAEWSAFRRILVNNVVLMLGVAVWIVLPMLIAIAIFPLKHAAWIRMLLFVPALLPPIIAGNVFRLVLSENGAFNESLRSVWLGFLAQGWLTDERIVLFTIIAVIAWATLGGGVILFSAGLSGIAPEIIEAARLDGANWRQMVWYIYRPALRPVTQFYGLVLIVTTVTGFFPWIFGLTQGGPGRASTTLDYTVYITFSQGGQYGRSSAIAVISIIYVAIAVGTVALVRRTRRDEDWSR